MRDKCLWVTSLQSRAGFIHNVLTMKILVTGAAGFIGYHVMEMLARRGDDVTGIDNINDYYAPELKYARLAECGFAREDVEWHLNIAQSTRFDNCTFIRMSIDDTEHLKSLFDRYSFDVVVNLAAQAGVRYSISHPFDYMHSNLDGFLNILECCRNHHVGHLVFASSSSVYGANNKVPYSETDMTDTPVSLYAASKKADELMAYSYSKLYGLRTTGLRYFTVYGPWGRPDMAPILFADAISRGEPIRVFNHGEMWRDFTYIDDIAKGTMGVIDSPAPKDQAAVPHTIYNIGRSRPVKLTDFISELEQALGRKARMEMLPMQPGDVCRTWADTSKLERELGYHPSVELPEGIGKFIAWYQSDKNPL
jgi:UDP-glucuronate 4-epimerase